MWPRALDVVTVALVLLILGAMIVLYGWRLPPDRYDEEYEDDEQADPPEG